MAVKSQKISNAGDYSFVAKFIITLFVVTFKTIRLCFRFVGAVITAFKANPARDTRSIVSTVHEFSGALPQATPQKAQVDFVDTVPVEPVEREFRIASRIFIAQLMQGDVRIGRIWFYTYEKAGKVRRVFKIDDRQVRKILGVDKYYMTEVAWNPTTGEAGIKDIKQAAFDEVVSIIMGRLQRAGGTKKMLPSPLALANDPVAPQAPAPAVKPVAAAPKVAAPAETPPAAEKKELPKAAPRTAKGDKFVGTISEMGRVNRPGRDGGQYQAYCLKLDQGGKHNTFYGVEIERELLERDCTPGDTVELIYMGRQPIEGGTMFKNLYKINVIKRHNQATKGA